VLQALPISAGAHPRAIQQTGVLPRQIISFTSRAMACVAAGMWSRKIAYRALLAALNSKLLNLMIDWQRSHRSGIPPCPLSAATFLRMIGSPAKKR
jgi:hypothetical protein